MTMTSGLSWKIALLSAAGFCALPLAAAAQTAGSASIGPGGASGPSAASAGGGEASTDGADTGEPSARKGRGHGRRGSGTYGVTVTPYVEAAQIVTARLSPGDETLTYSTLAAGVDASVSGRHNGGSVSLRYERRFGWGRAEDSDTIAGVARGYATLAPGLTLEAGGLAGRTRLEADGQAVLSPLENDEQVSQVYSAFAGPSLATHVGALAVNANYRFGYTKVEAPDVLPAIAGQPRVDVFDESTAHIADVHAGVKAGDLLPVGLGAGATYYREDVSNLDQRIENFAARADATVPVTNTLALVGGAGYEDVEVSSRDALRNSAGDPVVAADGRYVTDQSAPRVLGYDTSGFIWDAGVIWRPSRRTALEAHVGRRYGTTSYYGTFAYAPNSRSSLNISVYDNVAGFGGQLNRALIGLPTEFEATRNPLNGGIGGCVAALEGGTCLNGALGSVRSASFRARGVMATYGMNLGRLNAGVGGGYDRRKFIGAPGTILAQANGVIDENYWLTGYVDGRIDPQSGWRANVYANWFQSGSSLAGDATAVGATASYYRDLTRHLSATAAVGIDGIDRQDALTDEWIASALVGVRYSF
jgi:hypothetical protein